MIKLWGRANSSNVQKVIWTLEELGLPYDRVDVGGPFGGTDTPEYRAMNPLGVVPSLEADGATLFESNVIMRYICNAHAPDSPLYPSDPIARANVEIWMDFQQTSHNRLQTIVFQGIVRTLPEKRDMTAINAAIAELSGIWGILDGRLAERDYLAGDVFTLADIVFGMHAHRWLTLDIPRRPDLPNLKAWYDRMVKRPVFNERIYRLAIT